MGDKFLWFMYGAIFAFVLTLVTTTSPLKAKQNLKDWWVILTGSQK